MNGYGGSGGCISGDRVEWGMVIDMMVLDQLLVASQNTNKQSHGFV